MDKIYPTLWTERRGHGIPDLIPLDYFLWGRLKSWVFQCPVQNEERLRNRIIESGSWLHTKFISKISSTNGKSN